METVFDVTNHSTEQVSQQLYAVAQSKDEAQFGALFNQVRIQLPLDKQDKIINKWIDPATQHHLLTFISDSNRSDLLSHLISYPNLDYKVTVTRVDSKTNKQHWKYCDATALILACHNDNFEVCKLLIDGYNKHYYNKKNNSNKKNDKNKKNQNKINHNSNKPNTKYNDYNDDYDDHIVNVIDGDQRNAMSIICSKNGDR